MSSSSYPPIQIDIRSPNAATLQSSIHSHLLSRGWVDSSDPLMAEYVLVMLANSKGSEEIDQELSELIDEGRYDSSFTQWLWEEAARLLESHAGAAEASGSTAALAPSPRQQSQQRGTSGSPSTSKYPDTAAIAGGGSSRRDLQEGHSDRGSYRDQDGAYDARPRSPGLRRSASPAPRSSRQGAKAADHWQPRDARHERGGGWRRAGDRQEQQQAQRAPRELFAPARAELEDPDSRLSPPKPVTLAIDEAMQEDQADLLPATSPASGPREMKIRGTAPSLQSNNAGRELFFRSINAASSSVAASPTPPTGPRRMAQATPSTNGLSLLARAGIPDPRAPSFVPNLQPQANQTTRSSPSLSSRLSTMLPINAPLPPPASMTNPTQTTTDFPTKPLQASLCRYASACTNPLCEYSHPSPKASLAKRRGEIKEDPILTSPMPCRFGVECNSVECTYSHVSPAVFFLSTKAVNSTYGRSVEGASGVESTAVPCRFGEKCSNASCGYRHLDTAGNVVPSPALSRLVNPAGSSSSFSSSAEGAATGDVEMTEDADEDIAITSSSSSSLMGGKGPDGKPLGLDRPLGDNPSSSFHGSASLLGATGRPCKFGMACTRQGCWFFHPTAHLPSQKQAKTVITMKVSGPTGKVHISDRLSRFNQDGMEAAVGEVNGEGSAPVEKIIPTV